MTDDGIRPRSCWLEINLDALIHNLEQIQQRLEADRDTLCVVKADAYGHGAEIISDALAERDVTMLGVATLEEAQKLRDHGIKKDILIMGHMATYNVNELFEFDLTPMIFSYRMLLAINKEAKRRDVKKPVHLKTDTGMGRLGILPDELDDFLHQFKQLDHVVLDGVATHFADADGDHDYTGQQVERFNHVKTLVRDHGFDPSWWHAMNSAAIFSKGPATGNLVRPGISLYGYSPNPTLDAGDDLRPVMEARCKMADYKEVDAGHGVSYGRLYQPEEATWIGVLPIGYADGYTRAFSNKAHVLKNGEQRDVLGAVCMDMTIIDCRETDDPEGVVTLMGQDGEQSLWADTLADWMDSISYEVLSGFSQRLPRLYLRDDEVVAQKHEQGIERFNPPLQMESVVR